MKNIKHIILSFLFLTLVLAYSCKKDKVNVMDETASKDPCYCEPFPQPVIVTGDPSQYLEFDENYVSFLEVNPNDGNEFVYIHGEPESIKLRFYNNSTEEKRVLFNDKITGRISWSPKGWVLFQRSSDLSLFKIKSNGDSLTQLTFDNTYHFGTWNYTGDRFVVYNRFKNSYKTEIMDENGVVVDSVDLWNHSDGVWNHPDYYLGSHTNEVIVYDIVNKATKKKLDFAEGVAINSLGWVSFNEFLYTKGNKLYRYNVDTDFSEFLSCECYKNLYAVSSTLNFSKTIGVQILGTSIPNYKTLLSSRILELNSKGLEIHEINPE